MIPVSSVWRHAAATYDGSQWRIYLDGVLDGTSTPQGATPEAISNQHASLGTAMNTTGVAAGFFAGQLDEARIWSTARSGTQIASSLNTEITAPTAGLLGRWGLNDGTGTTATNSAGARQRHARQRPHLGRRALTSAIVACRWTASTTESPSAPRPAWATTTMTLEMWFKRTRAGVATSTGRTGLPTAIPLLTKGRSQVDTPANLNLNYFLGINTNNTATADDDRLAVDFEDTAGGLNHPFTAGRRSPQASGTTPQPLTTARHGASISTACSTARVRPRRHTRGHVDPARRLATAYDSTGAQAGFFAGSIDEARIWSVATIRCSDRRIDEHRAHRPLRRSPRTLGLE